MPQNFGLIVIGGGITGLSTMLAWSRVYDLKEKPALLVEQHKLVGGCVTTYARQGYHFDTTQLIPDVSELLEFFDLEVSLKRFEGYYAQLFLADPRTGDTRTFKVPSNRDEFIAYLVGLFPAEARTIRRFFDYLAGMHDELHYLKTEPGFWNIIKILTHCPKIISQSNRTYRQFLDSFKFKDETLLEILDLFSSFSGLSAERCAALLTASAINASLAGSYRPEKGFVEFPMQMRRKIEDHGGEIITATEVKRIIVENGTARGIELQDGTRFRADHVVTTADAKLSMLSMVGLEVLQAADRRYARKVQQMQMSPSSIFVNLGLDDEIDLNEYGLNCGYNVLTTGHSTFESMYRAWDENLQLLSEETFHCGVVAPALITGGKPVLSIHVVPAAMADWQESHEHDPETYLDKKREVADHFIRLVQRYMVPDLKGHIRFVDVCTPNTFAHFLNSPTGSNFDMMPTPDNFGMHRLKTRTPIRNLYMPKFSNGIWPSMQAGLQVVDMISGGKIMNGNARYMRPAATAAKASSKKKISD